MKLKYYEVKTDFGKYKVAPMIYHYANNGALCVELIRRCESFADITVNIPVMGGLEDDEACVDINNYPWAAKFLKDNELAKPTDFFGYSGFCTYPVYKFDLSKLNEVQE